MRVSVSLRLALGMEAVAYVEGAALRAAVDVRLGGLLVVIQIFCGFNSRPVSKKDLLTVAHPRITTHRFRLLLAAQWRPALF